MVQTDGNYFKQGIRHSDELVTAYYMKHGLEETLEKLEGMVFKVPKDLLHDNHDGAERYIIELYDSWCHLTYGRNKAKPQRYNGVRRDERDTILSDILIRGCVTPQRIILNSKKGNYSEDNSKSAMGYLAGRVKRDNLRVWVMDECEKGLVITPRCFIYKENNGLEPPLQDKLMREVTFAKAVESRNYILARRYLNRVDAISRSLYYNTIERRKYEVTSVLKRLHDVSLNDLLNCIPYREYKEMISSFNPDTIETQDILRLTGRATAWHVVRNNNYKFSGGKEVIRFSKEGDYGGILNDGLVPVLVKAVTNSRSQWYRNVQKAAELLHRHFNARPLVVRILCTKYDEGYFFEAAKDCFTLKLPLLRQMEKKIKELEHIKRRSL